jgi:hypothetical protein
MVENCRIDDCQRRLLVAEINRLQKELAETRAAFDQLINEKPCPPAKPPKETGAEGGVPAPAVTWACNRG